MSVLKLLRASARYNVLTPIAVLVAMTGAAQAQTQTISGNSGPVVIAAPTTALQNNGTIAGGGTTAITNANTVTTLDFINNALGATITGNKGVMVQVGVDSVSNAGVVVTDNEAMQLFYTGSFDNSGSITSGGGNALTFARLEQFRNTGVIVGDDLGVAVNNAVGATAFSNSNSITAATAVQLGGPVGAFINSGTITATGGSASNYAVTSGNSVFGSLTNRATGKIVSNSGTAIYVNNLTSLINDGIIQGGYSGVTANAIGTFRNSGSITGSSSAAAVSASKIDDFVNDGTIIGTTGVQISGGSNPNATFTNNNVIKGTNGNGVGLSELKDFVNNGEIDGKYAVYISGDVVTLTNTGTITSSASQGINVGGKTGAFRNSGDITGTSGGIYFGQGVTSSFDNSGNITGDNGVSLNGTLTNSFVNSGTIIGRTSDAARGYGFGTVLNTGVLTSLANSGSAFVASGAVASFENRGSIEGFNGVWLTNGTGSFVNSGSIVGRGDFGVYLQGTNGSFVNKSGGYIAAKGITNSNGYGVASQGSNKLTTFLNEAGATIEGGAHIDIVQTGLNAGTIHRAHTGAALKVMGTTSGSSFTNTGSVVAEDGNGAEVSAPNPFVLTNSGLIQGSSGKGSVYLISQNAGLKLLPGSQLVGAVRAGGGGILDASEYTGTTVIGLQNNLGASTTDGFSQILLNPNSGMFRVGTQIVSYEAPGANAPVAITTDTVNSIRSAIAEQYSGLGTTGAAQPSAYSATPASNPAADAAETAVLSELDTSAAQARYWARAFGGVSVDAAPDSLTNVHGGLALGALFEVDATTQLGALLAWSRSFAYLDANDQTVDTNSGVAGIYGRTELGVVRFDYSLLGGISAHSSSRDVIVVNVVDEVTADFASWFVAPQLGVSAPLLADDEGSVRIAASAGYVRGAVQGYTEAGDLFSASVPETAIEVLEVKLKLNGERVVASTEYGTVRATAKAGIVGQYGGGQSALPVNIAVAGGASGTITIAGTTGGTLYGAYAGFGLSADIGDNVVADGSFDFTYRSDGSSAFSIKGGLTGAF